MVKKSLQQSIFTTAQTLQRKVFLMILKTNFISKKYYNTNSVIPKRQAYVQLREKCLTYANPTA